MKSRFPWYDSLWLSRYAQACEIIEKSRPDLLDDFKKHFEVFRTDPSFSAVKSKRVLDSDFLIEARKVIESLQPTDLEKHEFFRMGRHVVHNHDFFTTLQRSLTDLVSDQAGEEVEPSYNFLSLYNNLGNCSIHMDSPQAKWTLDICIDQSDVWPIHFSKVLPWPEDMNQLGEDWAQQLKADSENQFAAYDLKPGEAVLFSGSSQWHYREPIAQPKEKGHFCHLAFLHYVPKGTADWISPDSWAEKFGIPELSGL
ncbi:MAG: hypothetical protein AAF357_13260 [Verrucomicrobiota bacterium]